MDVVFYCLFGRFCRCLEQRTHIHVETAVCVARGNDFGSAVMSVLAEFCNHDTGLAAFFPCKFSHHFLCFLKLAVVFDF